MTAFDNIKTNNWPATSNEFEDYLVLELPLNDGASLTESRRDIVAGNKVLHPKVALTNSSVVVGDAGDVIYSSGLSSTNGLATGNPGKNAFDGSLATYAQTNLSSDNSINVDFSSNPISYSSSVRIHCYAANGYSITNTYYLNNSASGTTFTGGAANFNGAAWITVASGSGTLNHLRLRLERGGGNSSAAGLYAIEVDGTILTEPAGGLKKHYDNNAVFSGTARINTATASNLAFGTGDFTVECWAYPEGNAAEEGIFQISTDTVGIATTATNVVSLQMLGGAYRSYANDGSRQWATSVTADQWVHLAVVRQSGTLRLYVNGVADSNTYSDPRDYSCRYINVGGYYDGNYLWTGSIQDLRVYNGVAKYTANFTPPGAILG
mgnify:FL=1|tara:strand:- start:13 stop:1152 length:1140 start_codon:yes stop_codon:yes gene_type:complete